MRSVEMIVEFPIEDANLPMPHLLGLANAAADVAAEPVRDAHAPDCRGARGRRGEAGLGAADAVGTNIRVPELRHHDFYRRKRRAGRGREVTEMDVAMAAVLVIGLLGSLVIYLWHDWHMRTREFREMRRRLLQMQEDRQKGETND